MQPGECRERYCAALQASSTTFPHGKPHYLACSPPSCCCPAHSLPSQSGVLGRWQGHLCGTGLQMPHPITTWVGSRFPGAGRFAQLQQGRICPSISLAMVLQTYLWLGPSNPPQPPILDKWHSVAYIQIHLTLKSMDWIGSWKKLLLTRSC